MNTLKRLVIILMVALAVVGATVAISQLNGGQASSLAAGADRPQFDGNASSGTSAGFRQGGGEGEGHGGSGVAGLIKNFLIFGLIGAAVIAVSLIWDNLSKLLRPAKPVLANDTPANPKGGD